MLKKDTIIKMATALKMDVAAVTAAIDNKDEADVPMTDGVTVFTAAELQTREAAVKAGGVEAGRDHAIKEAKKAAGLEYEGEGSLKIDRFITELTTKVVTEAKLPVDKKVSELTGMVEGLRSKLTEAQQQAQQKDTEVRGIRNDSIMLTHTIHMKPDNLSNEEWTALLKAGGVSIDEVDGAPVVRKGKDVMSDKVLKALPVADALKAFIDEKKWGKVVTDPAKSGGRGAGDSKQSGGTGDKAAIKNMKDLNAYFEANSIHAGSAAAHAVMQEVTKANPEFDFSPVPATA